MNDEQVRSLLAKTAEAASRGEFEPFKNLINFDGTAQNQIGLESHSAFSN